MRTAPALAFSGQIMIINFFCSKGDTLLVSDVNPGDDPKSITLKR